MKKILITGASGFLGHAVAEQLAKDYAVVRCGLRSDEDGVRRVDIRDGEAFRRLLDDEMPDELIHLAAYRDPDFCEEHVEEARRLNVDPVRVLCSCLPPKVKIVFISSDYVFRGDAPPYVEDSPRDPVNEYGKTKRDAEDLLLKRENAIILRVPVLVGMGASLEESGFISQILNGCKNSLEPIKLDDVAIRFPVWIRDVAGAVSFLLGKDADGVFHVSGPRGATRYAWTKEMGHMLNLTTNHIKPIYHDLRKARRPVNSQLATDKILGLGYSGFTDFAEVVKKAVAAVGDCGPRSTTSATNSDEEGDV